MIINVVLVFKCSLMPYFKSHEIIKKSIVKQNILYLKKESIICILCDYRIGRRSGSSSQSITTSYKNQTTEEV